MQNKLWIILPLPLILMVSWLTPAPAAPVSAKIPTWSPGLPVTQTLLLPETPPESQWFFSDSEAKKPEIAPEIKKMEWSKPAVVKGV